MSRGQTGIEEAVVLAAGIWREQDRMVRFLGRTAGRFDALAYGARKPASRWAGKLEPFTVLELRLATSRKSDLKTLREGEVIAPAPHVSDWKLAPIIQAAAELFILAGPGEGTCPEGFELARAFAAEVIRSNQPLTVLLALAFAWAEAAGFGRPEGTLPPRVAAFVGRAAADPPKQWHRYRLAPELAPVVLRIAKKHIEACTDREWRGMGQCRIS